MRGCSVLSQATFPVVRVPACMRYGSNQDAVAADEVGDVVGKHRAVHLPEATFPFAPEEGMTQDRGARCRYLACESLP